MRKFRPVFTILSLLACACQQESESRPIPHGVYYSQGTSESMIVEDSAIYFHVYADVEHSLRYIDRAYAYWMGPADSISLLPYSWTDPMRGQDYRWFSRYDRIARINPRSGGITWFTREGGDPRDRFGTSGTGVESVMGVNLFGCVMPLPPGYTLSADKPDESSSIHMYRLDPPGLINIRRFSRIDTSRMEILSEKRIGVVTAITMRLREDILPSSPILGLLHDGRTVFTIAGPGLDRIEDMAEACADNPLPG